MIYFLQGVDGGPVKIGTTVDIDQRRKQLEATYDRPLALLASMPGGREEERAIHARFSHLRLKRTEQFRPAADLFEFMGRPLLVGANADAVEAMPDRRAGLRPVRLDLTPEIHRLLRLVAADEEVSMAAFARDVLGRVLKVEAKERGIKA